MPTKPKVLVVGATGQVGKVVVEHLKTNPLVEVVAAARNPDKAKDLGVSVVRLDLDQIESIEPALKGIDRAFLATGYTIDMMRQSKAFLNAAKRQGVKHVVHLGACGGRLNPADMIAKMVEVTPATQGKFRNVFPPLVEDLLKTHQVEMFQRTI